MGEHFAEPAIIGGIPVCGDPVDESSLQQIKRCLTVADSVALLADHHKGYGCPIGGVVASRDHVIPAVVGFDIACGNKAARLDVPLEVVEPLIAPIMDEVASQVSFGVGRVSGWDIQDPLFDSPLWDSLPVLRQVSARGKPLKDLAREQLGTVGSGNHYCDIFKDEQSRVWVGVHFGSRGLGHRIATWFFEAIGAKDDMDATPVPIRADSDLGEQYLKAMELAGQYAYAGRDAVVARLAQILDAEIIEEVHNHHNFAWRETIDGVSYWVGRKGATPAQPGQRGFVGGSMGDNSVILEGVESPMSKRLLYSTIHGAGRVMSRTAATGKRRGGKVVREPGISRRAMDEWVARKGVELRGADVDEAPQAYKRLDEVIPHQGDTIRILHTLTPLGVAMAGKDTFDPYKD